MEAPDAPVLTEESDPCPGVEVYFESLHEDVTHITVWRIADGERQAVSGALRVPASGAFVVTDWHVPFGVVSTYVGEVFDAGGASLVGEAATITVESDEVWFQSQADPATAFPMLLDAASLPEISTPRRVEKMFVAGLRRPFLQDWGGGAIEGLQIALEATTGAELAAVQEALEFPPALIRTPPRFVTLPRLLSVSVQARQESLAWAHGGEAVTWVLVVDEVQPLSPAVFRPLVTWQDWMDAFPSDEYTWGDVLAVYGAGTWIDAVRNPPSA